MTPVEGVDADANAGVASDATGLRMALDFAYPDKYPDAPPLLRCSSLRGIADSAIAEAQAMVEGLVDENLGMPMVFTLASAAKEWVVERFGSEVGTADGNGGEGLDATEEGGRELDDEEWAAKLKRRRETGTAVTAETLAELLKRFQSAGGNDGLPVPDEEGRQRGVGAAAAELRPTGKEFFLSGKNVDAIRASTQQADEDDDFDLEGLSDLDELGDLDDAGEEAMLAALSVAN